MFILSVECINFRMGEILHFIETSEIEVKDLTTNIALEKKIIFHDEGHYSDYTFEIEEKVSEKKFITSAVNVNVH